MKLKFLIVFLAIFAVVALALPSSNDDFDELVKRQGKPTETKGLKDPKKSPEVSTKGLPATILLLIAEYGAKHVAKCRRNSCKTGGCPRLICTTLSTWSCCGLLCPVKIPKGNGKC